ncbi:hypothetical protein Cni_G06454 [Canna indica]|uniref:Uncharacterized protein n=1 Tax=Canna indica TaxID=4628 RepID=A0AAQ3JXA4_9LILI|nr:hypothetical protein Cni_G06454 [Canna indica]
MRFNRRCIEAIRRKMNSCAMQKNELAACEDTSAPFAAVDDRRFPVLCPKPRRFAPLSAVADPVRPLRRLPSHQADSSYSNTAMHLLDILLAKGGDENHAASSPPFFSGSPPRRTTNPVVHDARFGEDRPSPLTQSGQSPVSPNQGCARSKLGLLPATVRIEGFDCLSANRRGCSSITAVA